ncbi:MAG: DUF4297 family anti-phage-associated protein [Rikenellaceae bacterium]
MTATRSANATIAGYIYQFDYTIKCLLDLTNEYDYVDIENIEDVDIHSTAEDAAIQCKYYAGTEYNHSIIAKPIRLMLKHYSNVIKGIFQPINYKLYGFYHSGQDKLPPSITVDFLKTHFLTYTEKGVQYKLHEILALSDSELEKFLTFLSININAEEDTVQFKRIVSDLQAKFGCDDFEAEHYYYNGALKIISHAAKQNDTSQRRITKKEFLEQIDKKEILFNKWFLKYKGEKAYYTALRKQYFSSINISERFFLIDVGDSFNKAELKDLLLTISRKWSKLSKYESNPFCPYVYINNLNDTDLIALKLELQGDNINFIDGYPFKGSAFIGTAINQEANITNQIKLKLIDSLSNLNSTLQSHTKTKDIYQFYLNEPFWEPDNSFTKHTKIQIKDIISIKEII